MHEEDRQNAQPQIHPNAARANAARADEVIE
jgi:hypothetical protein